MFEVKKELYDTNELAEIDEIKEILRIRKEKKWIDEGKEKEIEEHFRLLEEIKLKENDIDEEIIERIKLEKDYISIYKNSVKNGLYSEKFIANLGKTDSILDEYKNVSDEEIRKKLEQEEKKIEESLEEKYWHYSKLDETKRGIKWIIEKIKKIEKRNFLSESQLRKIKLLVLKITVFADIETIDRDLLREANYSFIEINEEIKKEIEKIEEEEAKRTGLEELIDNFCKNVRTEKYRKEREKRRKKEIKKKKEEIKI